MARKPNYSFERNQRAKAKAAKREAKRQAKLAAKVETEDAEVNDVAKGSLDDAASASKGQANDD